MCTLGSISKQGLVPRNLSKPIFGSQTPALLLSDNKLPFLACVFCIIWFAILSALKKCLNVFPTIYDLIYRGYYVFLAFIIYILVMYALYYFLVNYYSKQQILRVLL